MKSILFLGFLIIEFNCQLTRHSADVLKRDRIYIEAHRCVSNGQKNHNSKEAILDAIKNGVEAFETDAWLTLDKKVVLSHNKETPNDSCEGPLKSLVITISTWSQLEKCKINGYKIPLLEDIMQITKGKIFMNLEIKDNNIEIWDKIQELIEKYEYYDQIGICSFNHAYFGKVEAYNNKFNRTIVFGFLHWSILDINKNDINSINKYKHQISLNAQYLKNNPNIIKLAHDRGMTVGLWFFSDVWPEPKNYYEIFDLGIDVIITDYPIKVSKQLEEYYLDQIKLEGCNSIEKNEKNISSCKSCEIGYVLVYIKEQYRNLCKLKYEIVPDLYIKDSYGIYHERNIFAIKMLFSPIKTNALCKKNGKIIFYFEWLFDLYGYDDGPFIRKYILNKEKVRYSQGYSLLTENHIKKLNFNKIQIYIDNNLIDENNFLCIDLFDSEYYVTYTVMGAHCYILYNGEEKVSYNVEFRLFDYNDLSFVTYNNKFLSNKDSWGSTKTIYFYSNIYNNSLCNNIKDPFQERISCINKIKNCMYCKDENSCIKCNSGFSLFSGQCLPSKNNENNLKYFTNDNGTNYYNCFSLINHCEECYYDEFSFNNFHCTKCSNGLNLSETYECNINKLIIPLVDSLSGKFIGFSCLNEKDQSKCHSHKIEIPNFSCWKFDDNFNHERNCIIYPDNEFIQKEYYKFYLGIAKEELSINFKVNEKVFIPEKEIYKKDEIIKFKRIQDILTEEDMIIFNKSNTCYSLFNKGYSNFLNEGIFPNITNPNICYNAFRFTEQNDILDCGFAKIAFNYGKKKYNIQTCYFIPNNKISPNMLVFYRSSLIEEMWGKNGTWGKSIRNNNQKISKNNNEENIRINNLLKERKLQENDEISFEMTIQDKNGKVIKMDSKSYNISIVENDNSLSKDDEEEDEENSEPVIFEQNKSNLIKFNLLISIYIILLFI